MYTTYFATHYLRPSNIYMILKVGDKYLDLSLFVNLLQKNFVVMEKLKQPAAIQARQNVWDKII